MAKNKKNRVEEDRPMTKQEILKEIGSTAIYLLVVLGLTFLILKYVGQRTVVEGSSMEYTLSDTESVWVDKLTYRFKDPERFDVVVFHPEYIADKKIYYIKRIIGLPGETVHIDELGNIYINGERLEEDFGAEIIASDKRYRAEGEVVLGENEYFVMGDNRNNSADSRRTEIGNINKDSFMGKAVCRIWPLNKWGLIKNE